MERRELEDRLRASLQARADDVQPTPELWERVSERTTRRARWQLGAWVLSGAAAVAVLVLGGIVLFNQQDGVRIDPRPDIADTPTGTATDVPVPASDTPTVVTTDGQGLYEVDPDTGEVVRELQAMAGFQEGNAIREVAVRPVADEDLTVALVLEREGSYDLEVMAFDADGARTDRLIFGPIGQATDLPPSPVWSADGRFVLWAGTNGPDGAPALWAHDWWRGAATDGDAAFGEAVPVTDDAEAVAPLFADDATVDLHTWIGPSDGESVVAATTPVGGSLQVALARQQVSTPTWQVAVAEAPFEGGSPVDLGVLDSGVELTLVARGSQTQDAEGGTLELLAGAMGDQVNRLDIPELTSGTAAPSDGWLTVAGDRAAVGFPGTAYLLTIAGDTIEDASVADQIALPEGTIGASVAVRRPAEQGSPTDDVTSTETAPEAEVGAALADDGAPRHVVTVTDGGGELALVDRTAPEAPLASWRRPDGLVVEAVPSQVVVHPDSTPTDLEVVSRWTVGESEVLVRTVVRDGQVLANEELPADLQATNQGSIAEMADSVPVFSPSGDWLAWVETPEGADGPAQVRLIGWDADGANGNEAAVVAPDDVRPVRLLDWALDGPGAAVLTLAPMSTPGTDAQQPTTMVELRLQVMDGALTQPTADDWTLVDLPGVVFAAGSYAIGDTAERYIAFQRDDEVVTSVAEAPETAVPTGAFAFSEGRVLAFGPGSAVVQRADGGWQRVQVDDGAATELPAPAGTAAFLPWPKG